MKINGIIIQNIGGINNLSLKFNENLNMICGVNGVGKTTILECIINSFSGYNSGNPKRNAKSERGSWNIDIDNKKIHFDTNSFLPHETRKDYEYLADSAHKVMYVKDERQINYQKLPGILPDDKRDYYRYQQLLLEGIRSESIKSWFTNRMVFKSMGNLTDSEIYNLDLATQCFSLLDENVTYSAIEHTNFEVMVNTPRGEILFEYLSSGFKSALFILLGLIKEIEYNSEPKVKVSEFDGVILIDEADAHLHPYWQGSFVDTLRKIFKSAQVIITTHSPHMIQVASFEEIIALGFNDLGEVIELDLIKSEFGFKGWTVEEILEDVMGLKETRSSDYIDVKVKFESALDDEDKQKATELYETLNKMLHPRSPMRKVYELQLGSLG
ncbi:AAA family ATPase [Paenibacillus sp. S150]|uniref:AAA family ATPase n=1 Tax=Paenibacillus sp. S150 TaxID=2749826 RepID=UPI001C574903|nr:AAA family ATPase [Paenibacillus sp. S150]MBW4083545.1 AAA family ATPase [Paenibacillus sp. S150]